MSYPPSDRFDHRIIDHGFTHHGRFTTSGNSEISDSSSDDNQSHHTFDEEEDDDEHTHLRRDEDSNHDDSDNNELLQERDQVRTMLNRTNRIGLVPGQEYYLLETRWWRNWCAYVGYNTHQRAFHRPGTIDNQGLVDEAGEVKRSKMEDDDYVYVPKDVWDYMIERYGGGPAIPRLCVKGSRAAPTIEVRKIPVTVIWSRKPKEQIPALFSRATTIGQFLDEMQKKNQI